MTSGNQKKRKVTLEDYCNTVLYCTVNEATREATNWWEQLSKKEEEGAAAAAAAAASSMQMRAWATHSPPIQSALHSTIQTQSNKKEKGTPKN